MLKHKAKRGIVFLMIFVLPLLYIAGYGMNVQAASTTPEYYLGNDKDLPSPPKGLPSIKFDDNEITGVGETNPPGETDPPGETEPPGETDPSGTDPSPSPNTEVELPEEETPLAPVSPSPSPTPEIELEDDEVPKGTGTLPKTGELPPVLFYGTGAMLTAFGAYLKRKFNKR
jgi:LPXTG-motif cell wall-anchored protein